MHEAPGKILHCHFTVRMFLDEYLLAVVIEGIHSDLQYHGSSLFEDLDGFGRSLENRVSTPVGEHGGHGLPFPWRMLGVHALINGDPLGGDHECLCRDLPHGLPGALSHFNAAQVDLDTAVPTKLDLTARRGIGSAFGRLHHGGHPAAIEVFIVFMRLGGGRDFLFHVLEALKEVPVVVPNGLAQRVFLPFSKEVPPPQFKGRHAQLPGHEVHEALRDKAALGVSVPPVGAHRRRVGVNAVRIHMAVLYDIGPHTVVARHGDDVGGRIPECSVRKIELGLKSGEGAVLLCPELGPRFHAAAEHGARHHFLAAAHESYRIPRHLPRGIGDHGFDGDVRFAAEGSTEIGDMNPHVDVGKPEHIGHNLLQYKGSLGAAPDFNLVLSFPQANDAVGLKSRMSAQREGEVRLDNLVRLVQALRDVPLSQTVVMEDVGSRLREVGRKATVCVEIFVDKHLPVLCRLHGVDQDRQRLIVDLDPGQGSFGMGQGIGNDHRHRLAGVPDFLDCKGILIMEPAGTEEYVAAPACHHGVDAIAPFGFRGVDRPDQGMSVVGPENLSMKHSRKLDVRDVSGPAGDLGVPVDPFKGFSYVFVVHAFHFIKSAKQTLSCFLLSSIGLEQTCRHARFPGHAYESHDREKIRNHEKNVKRDMETQALKPQLKTVQETEDQGAQGAFKRVPVSEDDHGNGDPASPADHIHEKHVLVSQGQKRSSHTHERSARNETEGPGEIHIHTHGVRDHRILPNGPDLQPDVRLVQDNRYGQDKQPGDVGQAVLMEESGPDDRNG